MHPEATFMGSHQPGHVAYLTRFQIGSYRSSQERRALAAPYFLLKEKNVSQQPKETVYSLRCLENKKPWTAQGLSYQLVI